MCLTSNMSLEDTKYSPIQRHRNILYLISQYLSDSGLKQTNTILWNEASLSPDCKICDNIDLDTIYLDFCGYYHLKFGKFPKILKRLEYEFNGSTIAKGKISKNTTKILVDEKKVKQESLDLNDFVITSSTLHSNEPQNDDSKSEMNSLKYRKGLEFSEQFPGEMRELAYIVERQIVRRRDNQIKWGDIQGNEHAKQVLIESVIWPLKFPQLFTDSLTKPWKGILFHGVSGVGKSALGKALCSETFPAVTFFDISASTLISKWRGESEKFVKVLFTMAKLYAPAVIFIDEFESLASRRDSPNDHEATKRFKNELLIQIDDLDSGAGNVLLLANSNLPWEIDEAFLRRFERKVLIDLPSCENRLNIIQQLLPITKEWIVTEKKQLIEASEGFTGADLKIACKEATMIQIRNKLKIGKMPEITFDDLFASMKQIKPSMFTSAAKHHQWHSKFGNQSF